MKTKLLLLAASAVLLTSSTFAADCCSKAEPHSCCSAAPQATTPPSDKSVYQLDNVWTNDSGKEVGLSSFTGRPQIVAMFFARCQYACPLLVYKMKQIEQALPQNTRGKVDFLLVTFDSEKDTPAELSKYRAGHDLGEHWTLLHGSAAEVQDFAAVLGIKYKQDAQGQFMHSNVLTLLNSKGEIAYQEPGLTLTTDEMVRQIEQVVKR
jgi:protein SCO1/2